MANGFGKEEGKSEREKEQINGLKGSREDGKELLSKGEGKRVQRCKEESQSSNDNSGRKHIDRWMKEGRKEDQKMEYKITNCTTLGHGTLLHMERGKMKENSSRTGLE